MKKTLFIVFVLGIVMLKSLLNAFGMGKEREPTMYPRQMNLSGNVFSLKMPENFSRDMPAQDMVERLDLEKSEALRNDGYVTLLRRWWDLREPGWFGKEQGTIMMSISVRTKPQNEAKIFKQPEYDFHDPLHFVVALYDSLNQRFRAHNEEAAANGDDDFVIYVPSLASRLGEDTFSSYEMASINNRQWATAGIVQGKQGNEFFALPLSEQHYLEIEFALMPSDNVSPYSYVGIATPKMNEIVDTFVMHYAADNVFEKVTAEEWMGKTFLGEMEARGLLRFEDVQIGPLDDF